MDRKLQILEISVNQDWYPLRVQKPADFLTWFRLDMEPITGEVTKKYGDSTKVGCWEGNKC